ncbi:hypothetical protein KSP40_PGU015921 [Platanthera guangdongensis]|uniref:Uncharacterized protein n=1 Tax=Platanthera guangdongensis TaxID=2320717 RepID=A0ABR2LW47_9ASPA
MTRATLGCQNRPSIFDDAKYQRSADMGAMRQKAGEESLSRSIRARIYIARPMIRNLKPSSQLAAHALSVFCSFSIARLGLRGSAFLLLHGDNLTSVDNRISHSPHPRKHPSCLLEILSSPQIFGQPLKFIANQGDTSQGVVIKVPNISTGILQVIITLCWSSTPWDTLFGKRNLPTYALFAKRKCTSKTRNIMFCPVCFVKTCVVALLPFVFSPNVRTARIFAGLKLLLDETLAERSGFTRFGGEKRRALGHQVSPPLRRLSITAKRIHPAASRTPTTSRVSGTRHSSPPHLGSSPNFQHQDSSWICRYSSHNTFSCRIFSCSIFPDKPSFVDRHRTSPPVLFSCDPGQALLDHLLL